MLVSLKFNADVGQGLTSCLSSSLYDGSSPFVGANTLGCAISQDGPELGCNPGRSAHEVRFRPCPTNLAVVSIRYPSYNE